MTWKRKYKLRIQTSNASLLCDIRGSNKDERETVDSVNPAEGWTTSEGTSGRGDSSSWKTTNNKGNERETFCWCSQKWLNMQYVGVLTSRSSCNFSHSSAVGTRFHTSGIKMTTVSVLSPGSNLNSVILCLEKGETKTSTRLKSDGHHLELLQNKDSREMATMWISKHTVFTDHCVQAERSRSVCSITQRTAVRITVLLSLAGLDPSSLDHDPPGSCSSPAFSSNRN